jgi:phospholipid-binding lipoprotein MlaA
MSEEDLGQTFGFFGIGNGFYLVVPFYGPTTLRDGIGDIGDTFLNPLTHVVDSLGVGVAVYAYRKMNELSFRIGDYETIKEAAIEPYEAIRDGYIQFRNAKIAE